MAGRQPPFILLNQLPRLPCVRPPIRQQLCPSCQAARRKLHSRIAAPPVPKPTPFVPDVQTFLTLIGRGLSQHASKIESWDTLFRLSSTQLRDLGIEPARNRKYLLQWRDKFRHGEFGIGGDAKHVGEGGAAECRLVEVKASEDAATQPMASLTTSPGTIKRVLNVPWTAPLTRSEETQDGQKPAEGQQESEAAVLQKQAEHQRHVKRPAALDEAAIRRAHPIAGVQFKPGQGIRAPHLNIVKDGQGQIGVIEVKEGMWEHRRGQKVDGGERRKAEVRFKRASAQRRSART